MNLPLGEYSIRTSDGVRNSNRAWPAITCVVAAVPGLAANACAMTSEAAAAAPKKTERLIYYSSPLCGRKRQLSAHSLTTAQRTKSTMAAHPIAGGRAPVVRSGRLPRYSVSPVTARRSFASSRRQGHLPQITLAGPGIGYSAGAAFGHHSRLAPPARVRGRRGWRYL